MKRLVAVSIGALIAAAAPAAHAQDAPLDRLERYIEIDTINPPGNESRGAEFFAQIFDEAGIDYETVESAPGRGNIWARLDGGDEPGLLLLHHMDVVPATREAWDSDPLEAVERDGKLFGRGALDTKSLGIMQLEAFLELARSGAPLDRDVVFMATADEEAGGLYGAGWLVEHRPEIFSRIGYVLNEGGAGTPVEDGVWFDVEVGQKRPYWLRLIATDEPGHGSSPRPTSAVTRLIAALERIQERPFEPRVTRPVRDMFAAASAYEPEEWKQALADIDAALLEPGFLERLQAERPGMHSLLRNTCSITMLAGSEKINVVPPVASAELDCRILPDQDAGEFLAAIEERIADDHIRVEQIMLFGPAQSSADTDLFRLLERVTREHYPGAGMVPSVTAGFTDSHFFRDLGIVSYGYGPFTASEEDISTVHGNNERIGIETFLRGVEIMTEVVGSFATGTGR